MVCVCFAQQTMRHMYALKQGQACRTGTDCCVYASANLPEPLHAEGRWQMSQLCCQDLIGHGCCAHMPTHCQTQSEIVCDDDQPQLWSHAQEV